MESEASMTVLHNRAYKSGDATSDTCPTCGGQLSNKATSSREGHHYDLECNVCQWSVPIDQPQPLVTDGGTSIQPPAQDIGTARAVLDAAHWDMAVQELATHIETGDSDLNGRLAMRALSVTEDRLALVIEHDGKTEYIALAPESDRFQTVTVHRGGKHWGPIHMEAWELDQRFPTEIDVCLRTDAPDELEVAR